MSEQDARPPIELEAQRLRRTLDMVQLELQRHVDALAKLQDLYAASREEVAAMRVVVLDTDNLVQAHIRNSRVLEDLLLAKSSVPLAAMGPDGRQADTELERILASTSWKLTAPLRRAVRMSKRLLGRE